MHTWTYSLPSGCGKLTFSAACEACLLFVQQHQKPTG
jgi:hypothetical protein